MSGAICAASTFFAYSRYSTSAAKKIDMSDIVDEPFRGVDWAAMDDIEMERSVMSIVLSHPGLLFLKTDPWQAAKSNASTGVS